jgi:hypothetical protein
VPVTLLVLVPPGEIGRRDGSGGQLAHAISAIGSALAAGPECTAVPW